MVSDAVNAEEAWNAAYNQLELQLDRANFDTWLRGAAFLGFEDDVFIIGVRNSYARDYLQSRLYRNVRRILCDVMARPVDVRFEVHQPAPTPPRRRRGSDRAEMPLFDYADQQAEAAQDDDRPIYERIKRPQRGGIPESDLNPRFTFDRFVTYGGNRMVYEAACAIADTPGHNYNPFLVYGGVGLGKTHLLHAIAHKARARGLRAVYIPSEAFTNDLIDAIRQKTMAMFRDKYRGVDVLLVDDVQFLAGKESSQEEFFHTFNHLVMFGKQIILACDRHPGELSLLEDRLRSRFTGGLVVDVQPPDYEARLAILTMWMQERSVRMSSAVLHTLANHPHINMRELEGLFNQIAAQALLSSAPLTADHATTAVERFHAPRSHGRAQTRLTLRQVIEATAAHYALEPHDLTGPKRTGRINEARQVAMYLARELTDEPLVSIGDAFGRSHTTVLHGLNKVAGELPRSRDLAEAIAQIRAMLGVG
jgi:chromosomal replication initiator protein